MRATTLLIAGLTALAILKPVEAREVTLGTGTFTVTEVVSDLVEPWAVGFLPQGALLITEREGRLLHIASDGNRVAVAGVPRVAADGQGGLLDVMIPRDFTQTREVFLTFAKPQGRGAGTALARGELSADGSRLRDVRVLFEMVRGTSGGRHFGSRVVEGGWLSVPHHRGPGCARHGPRPKHRDRHGPAHCARWKHPTRQPVCGHPRCAPRDLVLRPP